MKKPSDRSSSVICLIYSTICHVLCIRAYICHSYCTLQTSVYFQCGRNCSPLESPAEEQQPVYIHGAIMCVCVGCYFVWEITRAANPPFCLVTLAASVLFALCASHFSWYLFSVWIEPLHYHWEVTVLAQFVGRRFLCVNGSLYTCPLWSLHVIGQPPLCSVLRPYGVSMT